MRTTLCAHENTTPTHRDIGRVHRKGGHQGMDEYLLTKYTAMSW